MKERDTGTAPLRGVLEFDERDLSLAVRSRVRGGRLPTDAIVIDPLRSVPAQPVAVPRSLDAIDLHLGESSLARIHNVVDDDLFAVPSDHHRGREVLL